MAALIDGPAQPSSIRADREPHRPALKRVRPRPYAPICVCYGRDAADNLARRSAPERRSLEPSEVRPPLHLTALTYDRAMRTRAIDEDALRVVIERAFPGDQSVTWQRTPDGVSACVYRVDRGRDSFYLRVAEEVGEDLAVDAGVLDKLRDLGVSVPEVVHLDHLHPPIDRSVLIMTAIKGEPVALCTVEGEARQVVRAAGRDLALLNSVGVDGFGFISRAARRWPPKGTIEHHRDFVVSYLPDPWPGPIAELFIASEVEAFERLITEQRANCLDAAVLAHGDFDTTPIFHTSGRFTGIIDFGEIRGADPFFDLGHFLLHDRELLAWSLAGDLYAGYQEVCELPHDFEVGVLSSGVLVGLRQLGRWIERDQPPSGHVERQVRHRVARIRAMLDDLR